MTQSLELGKKGFFTSETNLGLRSTVSCDLLEVTGVDGG